MLTPGGGVGGVGPVAHLFDDRRRHRQLDVVAGSAKSFGQSGSPNSGRGNRNAKCGNHVVRDDEERHGNTLPLAPN